MSPYHATTHSRRIIPSAIEPLEARIAPATFTVLTSADSGAGSLRQAILDANALPGLDNITFNIPNVITATVILQSSLPTINDAVFLDGSSQPGTSDAPKIIILGSRSFPIDNPGLWLSGPSANGSTIKGVSVIGFAGDGLAIVGSDHNTVLASTFGISKLGPNGNGGNGIGLYNANYTTLGGSPVGEGLVVSANTASKAAIRIENSSHNKVLGSKIGTDLTGALARSNFGDGIAINGGTDNVIGAPGKGNVISGNLDGIKLVSALDVVIQGNLLGLTADGLHPLPIGNNGIEALSSRPKIGGTQPGEGNVIANSTRAGIYLFGSATGTSFTVIQGNLIGTDWLGNVIPFTLGKDGTRLPNTGTGNRQGILASGVSNVAIGGSTAGARNIISGNGTSDVKNPSFLDEYGGIILYNATNCTVAGNYIGTDPTGTKAAGNLNDGIRINGGTGITIGGTTSAARNIISANGLATNTAFTDFRSGITITGNPVATIIGNYIGTDVSGSKDLGNYLDGIRIGTVNSTSASSTAYNLVIGGDSAVKGNVISGNGGYGIHVGATALSPTYSVYNVQIGNNFIGTDAGGAKPIGNDSGGLYLTTKSSQTFVGVVRAGSENPSVIARNIISANGGAGITVDGDRPSIKNNYLGTDVGGNQALGNKLNGLLLTSSASNATIFNNVISANGSGATGQGAAGLAVSGSNHSISKNTIGLRANLNGALGNAGAGIYVFGTSSFVSIGNGESPNLIGGNGGDGITINSSTNGSLQVTSNTIGFSPNGGDGIHAFLAGKGSLSIQNNSISGNIGAGLTIHAVGSSSIRSNSIQNNGGDGVSISGSGTSSLLNNILSGNGGFGLNLSEGANSFVEGNTIGLLSNGTTVSGNRQGGILITGMAATLGGSDGFANIISGNNGPGITVNGAPVGTLLAKNWIGTDRLGHAAPNLGNTGAGILIQNSDGVTIGRQNSSVKNVIAGNGNSGKQPYSTGGIVLLNSTNTLIQNNYIGTDATGLVIAGNLGDGIHIEGGSGNVIGGSSEGSGNLISGNTGSGLSLNHAQLGTSILGNLIGTDQNGVVQPATALSPATGNAGDGITVLGSSDIQIGGTDAASRNVISGNGYAGVSIQNSSAITVQGNYLGTNADGQAIITESDRLTLSPWHTGNTHAGIYVANSHDLTIGGTVAGTGNVVSGNGLPNSLVGPYGGIYLASTTDSVVAGNLVGTDATGSLAQGNYGFGIEVDGGSGLLIGGSTPGARNVISANGQFGPGNFTYVLRSGIVVALGAGVTIAGNYIGTDASGTQSLGNFYDGIQVGPTNPEVDTPIGAVLIGGATPESGNVIAGNGANGIAIGNDLAPANYVLSPVQIGFNFIGTDATGTHALGNARDGILLDAGSTGVRVGLLLQNDLETPARNVIAANGGIGVNVSGTHHLIADNYIGLDATGSAPLGNGSVGVSVGGQLAAEDVAVLRNVIAGNRLGGLSLDGANQVVVAGNTIGLDPTRTIAFGNGDAGLSLYDRVHDIVIGPTTFHGQNIDGNVIGGSGSGGFNGSGIWIGGADVQNVRITHNSIGVYAGHAFSNVGSGIELGQAFVPRPPDGGPLIDVGPPAGSVTISDNSIAFNQFDGIRLGNAAHATITHNEIYGNGGLPIALGNFPVFNDPLDADAGANELQNNAEFRSAYLRYGATLARGSFAGAPNRDLRIEFYSYTTDSLGHEIGSTFLSEIIVHTDASGHATVSADLAALAPGARVGSTVTDLGTGNTSEYSFVNAAVAPVVYAVGTGPGVTGSAALLGSSESPFGTVLSLQPYGAKFRGGVNVTHADVDHDGLDDLVTAPQSGVQSVKIFSGFDGSLLASWTAAPARFTGGITLAAGDTNGDGQPEIITGLGQGGAPRVSVHEAISGIVNQSFLAFAAATRPGVNLVAGDLDGDGRAEIVASTATGRAAVRVFHGDGTPDGPAFRPFANVASFGAHVAIYTYNAQPMLLVGSGAGLRSTVASYTVEGHPWLPAFRVGAPGSTSAVSLAALNYPGYSNLVTATTDSPFIEEDSLYARPFSLPGRYGLNLG